VEKQFCCYAISVDQLLSPEEYLKRPQPLLDVRAPIEFNDGHIPGSFNAPILNDEERHEVGTVYKEQGNEAATALGHKLVAPFKKERVAIWQNFLREQDTPILTCWRGGDRSRIAQAWLKENGFSAYRLRGGYKALRAALIAPFAQSYSGYSVSGLTGSGKTTFLRSFKDPRVIDLEGFANHRGSSFGGMLNPQPRQATFENTLGLALHQAGFPNSPILLESESRMIGKIVVPKSFFEIMRSLPRIILNVSDETRLKNLYYDYVTEPLQETTKEKHLGFLLKSLDGIKDRLGGVSHEEIRGQITNAFAKKENDFEAHKVWIDSLLKDYYDPRYKYSLDKFPGQIVFRGSPEEVKAWLTNKTDLFT
jgi:tRNA 2-selenouridine synthase